MKKYEYDEKIIIQFDNNKRVSYNKKKYGPILDRVVEQSMKLQERIHNYYEMENDITYLYYWQQNTQQEKKIIIDTEDFGLIKNYYWQLNCNGYPQTRKNNKKIYLYRLIMNYFDFEKVIDHINRNPLDNRKSNLRIATYSENNFNKTLREDVGITKRGNKYRVTGGRKQETLCNTLEEARIIRKRFIS